MEIISSFWRYRELLLNMVSREIKVRYKQSILGYFWVILNPFFQMLVMTFVFGIIFKIKTWNLPYPIFLYAGLLPWNFFSVGLSSATNSLVEYSALIKKIYFPRELLPTASVFAKIVDLVLASSVFVLFLIIFRVSVSFNIFWILPIFLIQLIFTLGLSYFLSAFNLFYRDVQYLFNLILTLWLYLTPVFYPVDIVPERLRFVYSINPMSVLINAYRQAIFTNKTPNLFHLGIALVLSLLTFFIGGKVFKKLEGRFADVV